MGAEPVSEEDGGSPALERFNFLRRFDDPGQGRDSFVSDWEQILSGKRVRPAAAGGEEATEADEEGDGPVLYTEEQLAAARDEGVEIGHRRGYEEGRTAGDAEGFARGERSALSASRLSLEAEARTLLEHCKVQLERLMERQDQDRDELVGRLSAVCVNLLDMVIPGVIESHGVKAVVKALEEVLTRHSEQNMRVEVPPKHVEVVRGHIRTMCANDLYGKRAQVIADPDLGSGEIRIQWDRGSYQLGTDRAWRRLRERMDALLGGTSRSADEEEGAVHRETLPEDVAQASPGDGSSDPGGSLASPDES